MGLTPGDGDAGGLPPEFVGELFVGERIFICARRPGRSDLSGRSDNEVEKEVFEAPAVLSISMKSFSTFGRLNELVPMGPTIPAPKAKAKFEKV